MQAIHKVCLILTGVCVVILCVGIGIGIVHGGGKRVSNDSFIEYVAYDDEDYADYDSTLVMTKSTLARAGVIDVFQPEEVTGEMCSLP